MSAGDSLPAGGCVVCAAALRSTPTVILPTARLYACERCRTLHYSPRGTVAEQIAHHDAPEYLEHPYFQNRRAQLQRIRARCRTAFEEIGRVVDVASLRGRPVLDVGCSTGEFLEAARAIFGVLPIGIDVSRPAIAIARGKGITVEVATIDSASAAISDLPVIVAIDVVEHVLDPVEFFRGVAARLQPGGAGYFETPNPESTVYRVGAALSRATGGRPRAIIERLFPSEHQFYFPGAALGQAAAAAGLEVVRVFTRRIPWSDAAISLPLNAVLGLSQTADVLTGERTLACLLVRRPYRAAA